MRDSTHIDTHMWRFLQYTNFELGTRVPLIVRAPGYKSSVGQVTGGLAELVDMYPTVAELAGVPVRGEAVDGVSLVPFFQDPARISFPTMRRQGTLNKASHLYLPRLFYG